MNRKHLSRCLFLMLATSLVLVATAQQVQAIPAFARKYETSCQTCHVAFPKLNSFGEAFRNNGYRFPAGDDEVVKQKPVSLGAPAWKRVWPEAVWPSDIPGGSVPFALQITNRFDYRPDDPVSNEFMFPNEIELYSGGTLGEDISFYAAVTLLERNDFGGLHRLFGQFDSLGGTHLLNVKFGGFEPRAVPFSSHRRLTKTNYLLNNLQAGLDSALLGDVEIGHAHAGSNSFAFSNSQRGVELWGVKDGRWGGGFSWAFGVVNGNGLGGFTLVPPPVAEEDDHQDDHHDEAAAGGFVPLGEGHDDGGEGHDEGEGGHDGGDAHGLTFLDNNSSKDVYWRASYKFFGTTMTGRERGSAPGGESRNWIDNSFRVGTFGIRGQGRGGELLLEEEDYLRYGVDVDLWYRDLNLFGAYMWGRNERPGHDALLEFESRSWFAQADYVVFPWLIPAIRYEVASFDPIMEGDELVAPAMPSIRRLVPGVNLLIRANVRFSVEANHYFNDFAGNIYRFDLDFAF